MMCKSCWLILQKEGSTVDDGDDNSSGGVDGDNVYRGKAEPVLVLSSDLYSEEEILICNSRLSPCPAYMFYLLLLSNYYSNKFYIILFQERCSL